MLGFRGVRLGIVRQDIYAMQLRAIFQSYARVTKENYFIDLGITIPMVISALEVKFIKELIFKVKRSVEQETGVKINVRIGTMIETPRACIIADQIATEVDYFSCGTNDLTQTTLAISRDDYKSFIKKYYKLNILTSDPFAFLDTEGVGFLLENAIRKGRAANSNLKIGICGEHASEMMSINFLKDIGVDYLSCSVSKVVPTKLATAKYNLK